MTDTADTSPTFQSGPSTSLDNLEEVSTNVPESAQSIFNNVLKCNVLGSALQCNYTPTSAIRPMQSWDHIGVFKVHVGPKFKASNLPYEDGENYQLCNIDSDGKMRGASTPFQFLEKSAEGFVQVPGGSTDIFMIHSKSAYCMKELKRVLEEQHKLRKDCISLEEKVIGLKTELQETEKALQLQRRHQRREEQEQQALHVEQAAKTENELLKLVAFDHQAKEMQEEKKKVQLQSDQSREDQALLLEKISALEACTQQLAQEGRDREHVWQLKYQSLEEGRDREHVWQLKYQSLESENTDLYDNNHKLYEICRELINAVTDPNYIFKSFIDSQRRAANEAYQPGKCKAVIGFKGMLCDFVAERFPETMDLCIGHYEMVKDYLF